MAETPNPNEEIALDDIDAILDKEDPSFREDLSQVSTVQTEVELDADGSVSISDEFEEETTTEPKSKFKKIISQFKAGIRYRIQKIKLRLTNMLFSALVFLKTKPKEFLGFLLVQIKAIFGVIGAVFKSFGALSRIQKVTVFAVLLASVGVAMLTLKNLKGVWIPTLNPPLINSMAQLAEQEFTYSGESFEMFYRAFPRNPDLFLFNKFKVNLKPSEGHSNPMGAFEVVLELDSKDAAVEVQSRQVEFHDLIQRQFEGQTYPAMLTDLGKQHLKNLVKKNVDDLLSQGWVEDVHFQTFILKP